ncbi:MAG: TM2 domain-containing protein [Clostridia bacterium]|nr:TM2 domain-containing protein [Clostridia bacterium]
MDNGELKEVPASSINFVPHIGDEVEIFESTNNIIVSKIEKKTEPAVVQQPPVQNIPNIVINNANNNVNTNTNINGGIQGKPKNKWVALILCIFLGFFGAHKFYEGKIGMGVLYIFTCGLFFVGVIIDAIAILTKPNPYYV